MHDFRLQVKQRVLRRLRIAAARTDRSCACVWISRLPSLRATTNHLDTAACPLSPVRRSGDTAAATVSLAGWLAGSLVRHATSVRPCSILAAIATLFAPSPSLPPSPPLRTPCRRTDDAVVGTARHDLAIHGLGENQRSDEICRGKKRFHIYRSARREQR